MHLRHRARRPTARDLSTRPAPPAASRSAAWLEGERLFQAPPVRPVEPAVPVVVKIRRSRRTGLPDVVETPPGDEAAEGSPGWKGPRVFRVEPASNELQPPPEDPPAVTEPAAEALALEPLPPVPRRRRVGADRRPGPVIVRVFQPEPAAAPEPPAEPSGGRQIAALQAAMAEVGRILAEASRARALRF